MERYVKVEGKSYEDVLELLNQAIKDVRKQSERTDVFRFDKSFEYEYKEE